MFTDKELACTKERHEIEIAAQRATLQEQRTHIDILDTALTNAQSNVVRLEEEVIYNELFRNFIKLLLNLTFGFSFLFYILQFLFKTILDHFYIFD